LLVPIPVVPVRRYASLFGGDRVKRFVNIEPVALPPAGQTAPAAEHRFVRPTKLQDLQKTVVLGMTTDPEPGNFVVFQKSDGAVSEGYANGVDRSCWWTRLKWRPGCLGFSRKSQ
jgi:hypothetical protein